MLLAMIVWFLALWWFLRLLARSGAPGRPRPVRTRPILLLPDPPDPDDHLRHAEAELVRRRLAGDIDPATYQRAMHALAASRPHHVGG